MFENLFTDRLMVGFEALNFEMVVRVHLREPGSRRIPANSPLFQSGKAGAAPAENAKTV